MTATQVDGVPVVADEPAASSLPPNPRTGQPVYFRQIRKLLLEDGRELFGCVHCDFTSAAVASVRPHLVAHRDPTALPKGPVAGIDLLEVARRLEAVERIQDDRDTWRRRALKAEAELRRIRKAFGSLSVTS